MAWQTDPQQEKLPALRLLEAALHIRKQASQQVPGLCAGNRACHCKS